MAQILVPNPAHLASCLRSINGGSSTTITFINYLDVEVRVNWIDFDGKLKFYKALAPGSQYNQQTYVGHPWVVYTNTAYAVFHPLAGNNHRAIIDNPTRPGWNNSTTLIPILALAAVPCLRSLNGGASTYVTFFNNRPEAVRVYWIDMEGKKKLYKTLQHSGTYRQQTYVNHPWVITTVTAPERPLCIFHPTAAPGTRATIS
ncbi:von Hippel-Lindau disease tumor suppressor, beta/alpha domain-containing protein [Collybia nuda]|uniref:von Hippel-Lindau disease tumor suppressor, beta/alpha domain-containing protein n=1 Tax=Collybia nuda TaxID=64659 RepID=A0A9P5XVB1_9AGAR|nr:von Hippel-Lindau disease tumor suppressor, beta/alpha domain-containing protein [Collybia nuda]